MTIKIDVTLMKRLNLTLNQYVFVFGLLSSKKDTIRLINNKQQQIITEKDITYLKENNILTQNSTLTKELENIHLTTEFKKKALTPERFFDEFFEIYPTSVTRPDGIKDYLKGNIKKCRDVYQKIVGQDQELHEHILMCLKAEVAYRTPRPQSWQYMKKMYNWLSQEEWRTAEQMLKDNGTTTNKQPKYGTDIE